MITSGNTNLKTLASKEHWSREWGNSKPVLSFNPQQPFFRDIHNLINKHLPKNPEMTCLEVGCYPGTYMWYFNKFFEYQVSGIEYLENYIDSCNTNMESVGVNAEIIHADLFNFKPDHDGWDVVCSFGFIEHFEDTKTVIKKHLDLVKPGGYLVLVIPNHAGFNGKILKVVDPEKYKIHNLMPYEQMESDLKAIGGCEIIEGGYYGHIGFWNAALYDALMKKGKFIYYIARAPLYVLERLGQYIVPNTRFFAPNSVFVARKF